jgi:GMP synthase (glutamine-hydrolysing)
MKCGLSVANWECLKKSLTVIHSRGQALAVRVIGDITEERLRIVRAADRILDEELRQAELYSSVWQSFAVLLPVSTVGVMGDERTYERVIAIRAVTSVDGMTADWARLPHDLLARGVRANRFGSQRRQSRRL